MAYLQTASLETSMVQQEVDYFWETAVHSGKMSQIELQPSFEKTGIGSRKLLGFYQKSGRMR